MGNCFVSLGVSVCSAEWCKCKVCNLYVDPPPWCAVHNVYRCFQPPATHTPCARLIFWPPVSTSYFDHHHAIHTTTRLLTDTKHRDVGDIYFIMLKYITVFTFYGPGSSVGIATDYGLDGPGSMGTRFSACPDRSWGPPSLL